MKGLSLFWVVTLALCSSAAADTVGQTAVVRIPGSIKKSSIEFFKSLSPPSLATVEGRPSRETDTSATRVLYGVAMPPPKEDSKALAKWYLLVNPEIITTVGTPIPLEAGVTVTQEAKTPQAKVMDITPDCVAAWKRLKMWTNAKKGISPNTAEQIDASAENVRVLVLKTLQSGLLAGACGPDLIHKYEDLSRQLRSAYAEAKDFDLQRQLAALVDGVRIERQAWTQCFAKNPSIINVDYSIHLEPARLQDAALPDAASRPKDAGDQAVNKDVDGETVSTGPGNTYKGYEKLQRSQAVAQYKSMYLLARSCVAICTGNKAFASGAVIGRNLILTCAHAVARPGHGGVPAQHDAQHLTVRIGDFDPTDSNTPSSGPIRATILFQGTTPDGGGDRLDFALLEADIEGYVNAHLQTARFIYKGLQDDREKGRIDEDKMRSSMAASLFLPIQPLALADYVATEITPFSLVGYPGGDSEKICDNGEVIFPSRLREEEHDDRRIGITKGITDPQKVKEAQDLFDLIYREPKKEADGTYYYYTYNDRSPGIGAICPAIEGNSGGPAVAQCPDDPACMCIIGIVSEGQPKNASAWEPGVKYHEKLLPTTAIVRQIDASFVGARYGLKDSEPWYKHYQVNVVRRNPDGSFSPRE